MCVSRQNGLLEAKGETRPRERHRQQQLGVSANAARGTVKTSRRHSPFKPRRALVLTFPSKEALPGPVRCVRCAWYGPTLQRTRGNRDAMNRPDQATYRATCPHCRQLMLAHVPSVHIQTGSRMLMGASVRVTRDRSCSPSQTSSRWCEF